MQALQTVLNQVIDTKPLATPMALEVSPCARPVTLPVSPQEALALSAALTRCLVLPDELPADLLRSEDVRLGADEKHALWGVMEQWAKKHKMASLNTAIHKARISAPKADAPWPTAEEIWHRVIGLGRADNAAFVVDDWLEDALLALCMYFGRDAEGFEALSPAYSLSKGVMIYGPVGCGKTKILELIARADPRLSFRVYACPDVSRAYRKDGDEALEIYGAARTMCFDDLGFEDANAKHYGSTTNPLADVLTRRYQLHPRPLTHATTNDDAAAMLEKYGERVTSRMSEMFNIIQFSPEAPDRRLR